MTTIELQESFVNEQRIPVVLRARRGADATVAEICAHLERQHGWLQGLLDRHGAFLLRGFGAIESAADFERVIAGFSPRFLDYIGGTSPRRTIYGKILSSTELDPSTSLPLHQEMVYTDGPPDFVSLFCQCPPEHDGQTTLADMSQVARRLPADLVQRFERGGVRLRRTLPSQARAHEKVGVAKPWEEVFQTRDAREAERIVWQRGWSCHWIDDFMQVAQELRPATTRHRRTGTCVWYNQAHFFSPAGSIHWALRDGRIAQARALESALKTQPDMLDQVLHEDGSFIASSDIETICDTLAASEILLEWQRRDVLLVDNVLCAHGRRPFSGRRSLLAALLRERE